MRETQTLNVNAHTRALRAAERVDPDARLQEILDAEPTLKERILEMLPSSEVLDVAGRAVKGFVVPHWAAGVILAAMLTVMGFMYSRIDDQRDLMIRLATQLEERDKHELEYRKEFKDKLYVQELQINQITTKYEVVKQMLTPTQRRALEIQTEN